jgi:hypothetical protein
LRGGGIHYNDFIYAIEMADGVEVANGMDTEQAHTERWPRLRAALHSWRIRIPAFGERLNETRSHAIERFRPVRVVDEIYDAPDQWRWLLRPAITGFLALVSIAIGGSFTNSPFKLNIPGTWFFGVPATPNYGPTNQVELLISLVAVYGGLVMLIRVWIQLAKALRHRPHVPTKYLMWILAAWMIPMVVVAPMFSRDVFSYAAQGEMVSRHINPYQYGPFTLGTGAYVAPVDPLWGNTPAPYGPLFLILDGFFATTSAHHEFVTVIFLRALEVASVFSMAWCMPKLCKALGRDHGEAFVLAILNPIVIITMVGGAHNDGFMVALMLAGITAALYNHRVIGVALCALAASVKAPAAVGIIYIAWDWLGGGVATVKRLRPLAIAALISVAVMGTLTALSGLGLGWVSNLSTPGTVRSWAAPATSIGLAIAWVCNHLGLAVSPTPILSVTRLLGMVIAVVVALYLLRNYERIGWLKAMGLTMLVFVVMSPVVQPWYLSWGIILLAPVATGKIRTTMIVLSALSPFLGLPGGHDLLSQLVHANPVALGATAIATMVAVVMPLGRWTALGQIPEGELVS